MERSKPTRKASLPATQIEEVIWETWDKYTIDKDPYEQNDLASKMPQIVADMQAIIKEAHVPLPTQK
jgi:hypothetical protein